MRVDNALRAAKRKDEYALQNVYGTIYDEYQGLVAFVIRRYVVRKEDVEDLVHETFLSFFEYAKTHDIEAVQAFLTASARNVAVNFVRKYPNEEYVDEDSGHEDELGTFLIDLQSYLDEDEFELLYDYYVYDKSSDEMAIERNMSPAAIRQKVKRLKKKVKERFGEGL